MLDLITVGRVSLDLFSRDIGAPFVDIGSFETSVGGSPVNIAIGAARLGMRALAFTAVGDDEVGRFVRAYLAREGVDTAHVAVKTGRRTGMAVVGVQPPDRFPLLFYRENPADIHLEAGRGAQIAAAASAGIAAIRHSAEPRQYAQDVLALPGGEGALAGQNHFRRPGFAPRPVDASAGFWLAHAPDAAALRCRHRHGRGIPRGAGGLIQAR